MRITLSLAVLIAIGCGGAERPQEATAPPAARQPATPPPPALAEAQTLIANSAEFSEYEFTNAAYTLPMQQSAMHEPARAVAADLRKAGWIAVDGSGTVVLTPKAKGDKRFLVRQNGVMDIVPLARKEVIAADAVTRDEAGAPVVDFRWRWVPNEIGELFGDRYSGEQQARATLLWDGSQWSILRIRPRSGA
jgi:hypothetical protein